MPQTPPATIKDVARVAGCGIATASRVLNKSGPASTKMRERVERAASDLGFCFNAAGRALQSRRSMTIGCLVPSLANPVFAEAVQGVQAELLGSGYQILISCSNYDDAADNTSISTLLENNVDGIIATMVAPDRSTALLQAKQRGIPVSLMFHDPLDGLVTAYVDNFVAACEVARRFAALGHRRVGFLALRFSTSDRSRNRYAGFHAQCRASGLADPTLIEISEVEARHPEQLAAILARYRDITALFASNDFLAIAVQKAARDLEWKVPQDLSIIGFDGIEVGRLLEAPLTTIETSPEAMGRQAAQSLLHALQGLGLVQLPPLPFSFREGGTLAPPNPKRTDDDRVAAQPSSVHPAQDQN
ncbi:LacI family transcriptional regulator [Falsihalocynthiibacter arcticus]|uniref:LacI family transcriptional regulator n=2 Tax=Falsihalocynthiibacter arcticus TaxID=1579316 RepID=A0A126V417_9RHOB|nr:LacI family transcriptional regulator [Falsihalocynthiibacter arcticus]